MRKMAFWAILLFTASCSSRENTQTVQPLRVGTLLVAPRTDTDADVYVGIIEEETAAALSFSVAGTVAQTFANEGESVRKGDMLAEVNSTSALQTYHAAQAAWDQAKDACSRLKQLYDGQSLPEIKWVEAQTRLSQAESAFEIAKKNLEDCSLRAPFSGVIGKRQVSAGETVLPGMPVMTLLNINSVKVRFSVPEQEIAGINKESRIQVTVTALNDRTFTAGKIEKGTMANPATHTYDVRATLSNPGGELLPGMVCRVAVSSANAAQKIAIPIRAVQEAGNGTRFVWTVLNDSTVRTPVTTGKITGNDIVIIDGIRAGDRIVTDGMQKISQGSKIIW